MIPKSKRKIILIILDGYGESKKRTGNAIKLAKTPFINSLWKNYPHTLLKTDGQAVGIPKGNMGGSEVGHFTIGSGRITFQTLEQINQEIKSGRFQENSAILKALNHAKKQHTKLHLLGMISDAGVHSELNHLFTLLKLAKKHELNKVFIHGIADGRDVPEKSLEKYTRKIENFCKKEKNGQIATLIGRYYTMDRDRNWNRTKKAYELLVKGIGQSHQDSQTAIAEAYRQKIASDYYIKPILLNQNGLIEKNDAVIFFNFRTDRARQITEAFTNPKFSKFKTSHKKVNFVAFGPYTKLAPVVFPSPKIKQNLGEIFAKKSLKQLRIAETEKYAHVTYFFNSQIKEPYPKEDRILIDSPKTPSYAQKPEMSALKLTAEAVKQIKKEKYTVIILNYANPDLVGHSGELKATIKCIEVIDKCLKQLIQIALKHNYTCLLTGDHGNAEEMLYPDGSPCPAHSMNPVPFFIIDNQLKNLKLKRKQGLQDIAPTILELMNIKKPQVMSGQSLIDKL